MSLENWNAQKIVRYREALELELHDHDCEQRERSSLCHCSKRRREAVGFTVPPTIHFRSPACGNCGNDVDFDGDSFVCPTCSVSWSNRSSDGDQGRFTDDYGSDISGEQFGRRMIAIALGVSP